MLRVLCVGPLDARPRLVEEDERPLSCLDRRLERKEQEISPHLTRQRRPLQHHPRCRPRDRLETHEDAQHPLLCLAACRIATSMCTEWACPICECGCMAGGEVAPLHPWAGDGAKSAILVDSDSRTATSIKQTTNCEVRHFLSAIAGTCKRKTRIQANAILPRVLTAVYWPWIFFCDSAMALHSPWISVET